MKIQASCVASIFAVIGTLAFGCTGTRKGLHANEDPSEGKADSIHSSADHACLIVMRTVERIGSDKWRGNIDVASSALEGAQVRMKIRRYAEGAQQPVAWVNQVAVASGAPVGRMQRFVVDVSAATLGLQPPLDPGTKLELIPYLENASQAIYDHNRNANSNYLVWADMGMSDSPDVCPASPASRMGQDSADHHCNVVLRSATRAIDPETGAPLVENRFYVWEGFVDVAMTAEAGGASVFVLWAGKLNEHRALRAERVGAGEGGLSRYRFHLVSDLTAESPTAAQTKIRLIPYLEFPSGDRVFDHNVREDDYVLDFFVSDWSIPNTGNICR